jgi:CheY-like chemotaxis protein
VILDLGLPYKSGLELLRWIRGNPRLPRLPVVVLTGSDRRPDYERAAALGINAYIRKSIDCTERILAFVRRPSPKLLPC